MTQIESLIEKVSSDNLNDTYVERVNAIRNNSQLTDSINEFKIASTYAFDDSNFDETWGNFEDSTDWDNSWDQGVPDAK